MGQLTEKIHRNRSKNTRNRYGRNKSLETPKNRWKRQQRGKWFEQKVFNIGSKTRSNSLVSFSMRYLLNSIFVKLWLFVNFGAINFWFWWNQRVQIHKKRLRNRKIRLKISFLMSDIEIKTLFFVQKTVKTNLYIIHLKFFKVLRFSGLRPKYL